MFRVGLYARVSTHDQKTLSLQIRTMREYAGKRGWEIAIQIKEVGSGAVERELREKLMAAARRREIDVVLVWRLDRWGRSLADLVVTLMSVRAVGDLCDEDAPGTSRRFLELALDGLRPGHKAPGHPPMSVKQLGRVLSER